MNQFWTDLLGCEVQPCGLGARDTLRLEAGFNLYGADMDETTTPSESNLDWTVAWLDSKRNFVGREALAKQRQLGVKRQLVGLVMEEAGVLRSHVRVWVDGQDVGEITSGGFSPTLGCASAMAEDFLMPLWIPQWQKLETRQIKYKFASRSCLFKATYQENT